MSAEIALLLPVLGRPRNAAKVVKSIQAATKVPYELVFLCSPDDDAQIRACRRTGARVLTVTWPAGRADWAKKLEHGRTYTTAPYLLLGADDLHFHHGWDRAVLSAFKATDAGVVGTRDGGNRLVERGLHSTHPVVSRAYADAHGTIDEPHLMLHQGYDHQYADNELCETAMFRGRWYFCREAYVEHLHPAWRKGDYDATYAKGGKRASSDQRLFMRRRRLWGGTRHHMRNRK